MSLGLIGLFDFGTTGFRAWMMMGYTAQQLGVKEGSGLDCPAAPAGWVTSAAQHTNSFHVNRHVRTWEPVSCINFTWRCPVNKSVQRRSVTH